MKSLYIHQLRDMYSAETQLTKALPLMAKAASDEQLRQSFEQHLQETEGQIQRLQQIFDKLGEKPTGETCRAMEGLVREGKETIDMKGDDQVKDAALIVASQKIEHYEIAGYGSLATFANMMQETEAAELLNATLKEERLTDEKLTTLAEQSINQKAAQK